MKNDDMRRISAWAVILAIPKATMLRIETLRRDLRPNGGHTTRTIRLIRRRWSVSGTADGLATGAYSKCVVFRSALGKRGFDHWLWVHQQCWS